MFVSIDNDLPNYAVFDYTMSYNSPNRTSLDGIDDGNDIDIPMSDTFSAFIDISSVCA